MPTIEQKKSRDSSSSSEVRSSSGDGRGSLAPPIGSLPGDQPIIGTKIPKKEETSRKSSFNFKKAAGHFSKIALPILLLAMGLMAKFKTKNGNPTVPRVETETPRQKTERILKYNKNKPSKKLENDNQLLNALQGKEFDDWAKALEDNLGLNVEANVWRDIANDSQEHSTRKEQEMILKVMGGVDENGIPNMTRDDVLEVKVHYEEKKDSLDKNQTSSVEVELDDNPALEFEGIGDEGQTVVASAHPDFNDNKALYIESFKVTPKAVAKTSSNFKAPAA